MICSSLFSAISKQVFVWFVLPCFEQSASEFSSDLFFLVFSKQVYVFLKRWFFEQNLVIIVMLSFWWFQDFLFFWIGSILGSNALTRDVDLTFFFFFLPKIRLLTGFWLDLGCWCRLLTVFWLALNGGHLLGATLNGVFLSPYGGHLLGASLYRAFLSPYGYRLLTGFWLVLDQMGVTFWVPWLTQRGKKVGLSYRVLFSPSFWVWSAFLVFLMSFFLAFFWAINVTNDEFICRWAEAYCEAKVMSFEKSS